MEGRQRRSFTDDYKRQAVDLVASSGRSIGFFSELLEPFFWGTLLKLGVREPPGLQEVYASQGREEISPAPTPASAPASRRPAATLRSPVRTRCRYCRRLPLGQLFQ